MDDFPRIALFGPREMRRLALLGLAVIGLFAGAVAYLRPAMPARPAPARPVAVATPRPQVFVGVMPASGSLAYVMTRVDSPRSGPQPLMSALRTDDGGRTWHRIQTPVAAPNVSLIPLRGSPSEVALVAYPLSAGFGPDGAATGPEYWLSHDRGDHWTRIALPGDGGARGIQFADADHWFLISQDVSQGAGNFTVHASRDHGSTWQDVYDVSVADPKLNGLTVFGAGLEVGGGATWLMLTLGTPVSAAGMPGQAARQYRYQLLRSFDDGGTWNPVNLPSPPEGTPEDTIDTLPQLEPDGRGWMFVYSNRGATPAQRSQPQPYISTTTDGGTTWSPARVSGHYPVFTLSGSSDWWATDGHLLFRSRDLGVTWSSSKPSLPSRVMLQTITRATPQVAWNVFGNFYGGQVSQEPDRTHVLLTTDGGRHWSEVRLPGL